MAAPIESVRHSTAHLMAAAVLELFPGTKLGVGPVVPNGFYYDFETPKPLVANDLARIEKRMREIIKRKEDFRREEMKLDDAITFFRERTQEYKVALLTDLKTKGTTAVAADESQDLDIKKPEVASVYWTGKFVDLCRGPHVSSTGELGVFKLTKLAGAYWRGDQRNAQLTRVYGLAFRTQAEMDEHVKNLELAAERDHRKLGKELELFTFSDEVGPGLPLFYPKGARLRRSIEEFVGALQEARGYEAIWIPHITKGDLYATSGHLEKYDALFPPMALPGEAEYYLKPMNCPHFMMLYRSLPKSYRDLPVRYVSTTTNYRYEKSGELTGLTRVRALTQDDCHVFCTPDQIETEIDLMLDMIAATYRAFQFKNFEVRVSVRDPRALQKYIGDAATWDGSEKTLEKLVNARGWKYGVDQGEAAFYGPKLDFKAKDVLGREWQLSTIQLDMNLPARFRLEYVDSDGQRKRPVVIHRAILGSTERFLGILIEHFGGAFPTWLAPVHAAIVPVSEKFAAATKKLVALLKKEGIRVEEYDARERVGANIRRAIMMKVPYMLVVGDKEKSLKNLTVRIRGEKAEKRMTLPSFVKRVKSEIEKRK